MSWFEYGTPKRRHLRKGVFLRVRNLPENLLKSAKKILKPGEMIEWVEVSGIEANGKVLLEFWCAHEFSPEIGRLQKKIPGFHRRFTVFHLFVDENPEWICEGDLGRGYRE
jgi:hypothetical protein